MAHADPRPAYLGRLNIRFPKGRNPVSHKRSAAAVQARYDDTSNIRTKYKGSRSGWMNSYRTSGIPIFGEDDAADRADWSVGHVAARNQLEAKLRGDAAGTGVSLQDVGAENSHALGHGDYGTDHELSAPAASKAQNTEQLAIELGMRAAAQQLNRGMPAGQSLVHAKITDVLHPETGHLLARRFKLIRKSHAGDKSGTVVFDHLMDGERLSISKDEAYTIGRRAHDALTSRRITEAPRPNSPSWREANMPTWLGGRGARKGMGGTVAPTQGQLKGHQEGVLGELQARQRRLRGGSRFHGVVRDRQGVSMVGPAFTDARFPSWKNTWGTSRSGQAALDMQRDWMQGHVEKAGSDRASLESSGSLPASDATTLLKHVGVLESHFAGHLSAVAGWIDDRVDRRPDDDDSKGFGDHIESRFDPRQLGVDKQRSDMLDSTRRAVSALRRLEKERGGSGTDLLRSDQLKLLKAAHIYRGNLIEEHTPVLQ